MDLGLNRAASRVLVVLGIAAGILAGSFSVAHAQPVSGRIDFQEVAGHWGTLEELRANPRAASDSDFITAGPCKYKQSVDRAHVSGIEASVHGIWKSYLPGCPLKANIDTALQAVYCNQFGCNWKTVTSSSGDVRAGGGAGGRVTARRVCSSTKKIGWRGRVDVDLIGVNDPPGYTYSPGVDLHCHP